jgi:hypothetical protein
MPSWLMVEKDLLVPTAADAIILSECCKDRNGRQFGCYTFCDILLRSIERRYRMWLNARVEIALTSELQRVIAQAQGAYQPGEHDSAI